MNDALRLAARDLRGGLGGLGLLLICLAIAVAGIAAVTSLSAAFLSSIADNGRSLLGGDLILSVAQRDANPDERMAIDRLGRSSRSVTLRAMVVGPDQRAVLAELGGVDAAWPLAGRFEVDSGGTRPNGAEVALGRELAERLGVGRGHSVRIGSSVLRVSAIIRSLPGSSGFALAPPAIVDEAGLAATRLVQPGSLTTTHYRILVAPPVDPGAAGRAFQRRFASGGWRVSDRSDAAGGPRRFVDRVGQMLLLIALSALAIGGLGISSAVAAFVASRRPAIAVLKLLGAPTRTVATMLAIEIVVIAAVAILIGLMVGAAAPALVADAASGFLPLPLDRSLQSAALGQAGLFGVLVAIAASWGPVARGVEERPAEALRGDLPGNGERRARRLWVPLAAMAATAALAIASASDAWLTAIGIAGVAVVAAGFAGLGYGLRWLARHLRHRGGPLARLGIAALDRPGAATVRLSVASGLGLSLLLMLAGVGSSLTHELQSNIPRQAPALFLVDIPAREQQRFAALVGRNAPGAELRMVPTLRGPVVAINGTRVVDMPSIPEGAWVLRGDRGLTFAKSLPPGNRIVAGRWWPQDYAGPPLISLDADAARLLNLKLGDTLTVAVLGRPIEARIASFREIDWRSLGFNFAIIFAPGTLEKAPYTLLATIAPASGQSIAPVERALTRALPMVSAIRVRDLIDQLAAILTGLDRAVRTATGFAIAIGIIVLAGSVVATRRSRERDSVLLKLVGATRGEVVIVQLIEFAALSMAAALAAFATGVAMAAAIVRWLFDLPFAPDWATLLILPLAAIAVATGAALLAALPALNARPAAALRAL